MWDGLGCEKASPQAGAEVGSRWTRRRLLHEISEKRTFLPPRCPLNSLGLLSGLWSPFSVALTGWLVSFPLVFSFTFSPSSRSAAPPFSLLICQYQHAFGSDPAGPWPLSHLLYSIPTFTPFGRLFPFLTFGLF